MDIDITVAIPGTALVGEGPFWDRHTGRLSWVDILGGTIHDDDPASGDRRCLRLPTMVGAAVPKRSGGFVAATAQGFADVAPDGSWKTRADILPAGLRMNDAKCDPAGRLWAGSCELGFAPGQGAMYVLSPGWSSEQVLSGLTLPNGLDWSPDMRTFYLVDTVEGELCCFDVDPDCLAPVNRRLLASFPESSGLPDGMTVDAVGCLWIALWDGGRVVRLSPDGQLLAEVPMPVARPTSCAFGGSRLEVLYVTTAREGLNTEPGDPSGSVLAVRGLDARGLPAQRFAG